MAKVYHRKNTSDKILEGLIAGLLGGVVVALLMLLVDLLTPDRSWWSTPSVIGSLFTGVTNFNTASPDMGSLLIGLIIHFIVFGLIGVGFTFYRPIFRRFNLNMVLAGAIFGAVMWLLVFLLFFNALWPGFLARQNSIALFVATVIGGATMGWWLSRPARPATQTETKTAS